MGRPLSTRPKHLPNGKWQASLPVARGAKERVSCRRFPDELAATRWLADGIAALKAGRPVPDPRMYLSAHAGYEPAAIDERAAVPPALAEVAWAWHHAYYEVFRRADLGRANDVRGYIENHILPFFGPRLSTIADLDDPTRGPAMCTQFAQHLAAQDATTSSTIGNSCHGGELLDAPTAAARYGTSVATVNRRRRDGSLVAAGFGSRGEQLYRVEDLQEPPGAANVRATGPRKSYATDILRTLSKILEYARTRAWLQRDPMSGVSAITPDAAKLRTPDPESRPRPITFRECALLAAHLPVVHQLVLVLLRVLALRISEAYGIRVGDVVEAEDGMGVVLIEKQGGRKFDQRDENGQFLRTDERQNVKTSTSYRLLVVPAPLMDVIEVVVQAFHTDPVTGEIDRNARLIPGLKAANKSGQSAFRTAFDRAAQQEQMAFDDIGFKIQPHHLRKSLSTELSYEGGTDSLIIKRILGHVAGQDVLSRHYILSTSDLAPLKKAAEIVAKQIRDEVGTLITPTTKRTRYASSDPATRCAQYTELVLSEAGWRPVLDDDEVLCDTARVAAELDIALTTARRWMREGRLRTHVRNFGDQPTRVALLSDVRALAQMRNPGPSLGTVAAELNMSYHEALRTVHRLRALGPEVEADDFELTDADVEALRSEHGRVSALHRRAMKVHEAAKVLGRAESTLYLWIRIGRLDADPESDSSGAKFVSRDDVAALAGTASTPEPADAVSLADLRQLTGVPDRHLRDLVRAGHLKAVPCDRRVTVTTESVLRWAGGYRPDLLRKLE